MKDHLILFRRYEYENSQLVSFHSFFRRIRAASVEEALQIARRDYPDYLSDVFDEREFIDKPSVASQFSQC